MANKKWVREAKTRPGPKKERSQWRRCRRARVIALVDQLESRVLLSHTSLLLARLPAYPSSGHAFTNFIITAHTSHSLSGPQGLSPAMMQQAYGINEITFGSVTGDGTGQTIAIVDAYNDPDIAADLHSFDQQFGLVDPVLTQINEHGSSSLPGTDPSGRGDSWAVETSLDVEWAHAVAPGAKIVLVEANSASDSDLTAAVNTARNYAGVSVVSLSWGSTESSGDLSENANYTTPSGHTGVTFVVSSGDNGAFDSGTTAKTVDYPAASPNVVAVGGTTLTTDSSGDYISESGWGDGNASGAAGGSGGGVSQYESQPTYQKGIVTQTTSKRALPDVAMDADPNSGVAVFDSWDSPSSPWIQVGGTSLAAPMWAGIIAIANQGRALTGKAALTGAQTLSSLYAAPSTDFHDITTGNNGYATGPGFDLVTGRGTPIANQLVAYLAGTTAATTPTQPAHVTPTIGSFTINSASVVVGASITLTAANVQETGGTISAVKFYRESNNTNGLQIGSDTLIGAGIKSGNNWTITASTTGLAPGTYTFYVVATDASSVNTSPSVATLTVTAPAASNDNFVSATAITGKSTNVTGSNVNATRQAGEPFIAGNTGGKSVWWVWTAPASGKVTLNTHGSSFDTLLGIYTGATISSLTTIASNDDDLANRSLTSALTFNAVAGQTYHIDVDGYNGASGNIALSLLEAAAPTNNNFANAAVVSGSTFTWTGTNVGATRETAEPYIAGNAGGASVWIAWTAHSTKSVTLTTAHSSFDTILGAYRGTSLSKLTLVAGNDDDVAHGVLTSTIKFNAIAGTTYYFAVDGYNGATGAIDLALT